jgi:vitamin B12 transporter
MSERLEQSSWYKSAWGESNNQLLDLNNRTTGVYLNDRINVGDIWYTTLGWRGDDHDQFGKQATYRITTVAHLDRIGLSGLKVRASYGTSFKSPALYQTYDPVYGNPDLQPETSRGWEVGLDHQPKDSRYAAGVTYFDTRFEGLIQIVETEPWIWRMDNTGEASSLGGEIYAQAKFELATLRMEYTNTQTRDEATGRPLVRRPRHKVRLVASGSPVDKINLGAEVVYTGDRFDTDYDAWPSERVVLSDYTVVNLTGSFRVSSSVTVRARVDNLFDETYEEILGYNSSPAALYLGLKLTL